MTIDQVKQTIEAAVPNSTAYVLDPMNDGQHLQAFVVSSEFADMPVFKQQQMVMRAMKGVFETVHAMSLKTFTPEKWQQERSQFGL